MSRRFVLLSLALMALLTACAAPQGAPVVFQPADRDGYQSVLWEGREYVPFCPFDPQERGTYLGYLEGDEDDQLYTWADHSAEEWLILYLNSGLMNDTMLLREVSVTAYPDGVAPDPEYDWNPPAQADH